jgi:hypothetical protein
VADLILLPLRTRSRLTRYQAFQLRQVAELRERQKLSPRAPGPGDGRSLKAGVDIDGPLAKGRRLPSRTRLRPAA